VLALVFRRFVPGSSFLDPCFGRFLGMLILVPGRFLKRFIPGFSFLNIAGRGVASSGTGGFRLTRQPSAATRPPTIAPPANYG